MYRTTSLHTQNDQPLLLFSQDMTLPIASSNYHLPLCWLMLFQGSNLKLQKIYNHKGQKTCHYTTLITVKEAALDIYLKRSERIKILLGNRCEKYFDLWQQYIERCAEEYIYIDATALWMACGEQEYIDNLKSSLRGLQWLMSDQCCWQRSRLELIPLVGRMFDPSTGALKNENFYHLLFQSGIIDSNDRIYIDKNMLQGKT